MAIAADPAVAQLCYLQASQVDGPIGKLAGLTLWDRDDESVGTLDGVLLDASARRVRYFVVQTDTSRYLLPVESAFTLETGMGSERLVAQSDGLVMQPFDPETVKPFSEDDALTAMFAV